MNKMVKIRYTDGTEEKFYASDFIYLDKQACFRLLDQNGELLPIAFPRENIRSIENCD